MKDMPTNNTFLEKAWKKNTKYSLGSNGKYNRFSIIEFAELAGNKERMRWN